MPVKKVLVCDRCDEEVSVQVFLVHTGRRMNAAGSMETDIENAYLCPKCLLEFVLSYANRGREEGDEVYKFTSQRTQEGKGQKGTNRN